ncbi:TPA: hypothetical protein ACS787_003591 [Providencia alcalifaciens]|uniref:hypothetical protein n=1 Tax=Providencia alcalifaciens TaxID=126385 RepID=UPI00044E674F|nr:hypothetical protein [Providencia alcalifaciens]ETT04938.1 hypothetical protein HMPREF1562_2288 [Providencia alcalifaciens F90-2004]
MCNGKSTLEKLAEVVNRNSDLNKKEIKEHIDNIHKRSMYKAELKYDVLSCLFLCMENYRLSIDAVYEVLMDIKKDLDFEFNTKNHLDDCDDEISY